MLGNDVVDLEDPETRPDTFRPRFDQRVFDATERRAIKQDVDPHARRWSHWAAKEAAYKLAKQIDEHFVFSPSKLIARFTLSSTQAGDAVTRSGTLELPQALAGGVSRLELRCEVAERRVHVVALPQNGDWEAVMSSVGRLRDGEDASVAVRRMAREGIARDLGIESERVSIGRRGRIPTVEIDGKRRHMGLTLSHHGRFLAFAMTHRIEVGAGEEEIGGVPGSRRRSA